MKKMEILESVYKPFQWYRDPKNGTQMTENQADITNQIVEYYIPYNLRTKLDQSMLAGLPKEYLIPPRNPSKLQNLVAKLCFEMEENNWKFFDCLPEKLCISEGILRQTFLSIAKEIVEDGVNWGRIISLITFCGVMSCYIMKQKKPQLVVEISKLLTEFINENLMNWIRSNGGWVRLF